jgi:hypothetical protein
VHCVPETGDILTANGLAEPTGNDRYERNWRWFVLATLFLATSLNYLDRQTLANAADPTSREFGLDNEKRGAMLATFVAALVRAIESGFAAFVVKKVGDMTRDKAEYDLASLLLAGLFTLGVLSVFALVRARWIRVRDESRFARPESTG